MTAPSQPPPSNDAYATYELPALSGQALEYSYLSIGLGFYLLAAVEWGLYVLGIGHEAPSGFLLRDLGCGTLGWFAYAASRWKGLAYRHTFLQTCIVAASVAWPLSGAAMNDGGATSPYTVSVATILFCCGLVIPGGAARIAWPVMLHVVSFYVSLTLRGERIFGDLRSIEFTLFVFTAAALAVVYAEVLERWRRRVAIASSTDGLTSLLNRTYFLQRFRERKSGAKETRRSVGVLMFDIDHFKRVNDDYGHDAGDAAIRFVAKTLRERVRGDDGLVARLGGEEFVLVLDGCDEPTALEVAERVRKAVSAVPLAFDSHSIRLTVSVGVVASAVDDLRSPEELLRAADQALYASKRGGRDRVTAASALPTEMRAAS